MDPILDIRRVRADLFTYSLRAPGQPPRPVDNYFVSVELCLHDAAELLHNYFDRVELHLAGQQLGLATVEQLRCPALRQHLLLARLQARRQGDAMPPPDDGNARPRAGDDPGPRRRRAAA